MKYTVLIFIFFIIKPVFSQLKISKELAEKMISLPLKCAQKEYPNKLGQVLNSETDLRSPNELHPAFYGCFDWHSSVHGHWLMVKLIKIFPDLKPVDSVRNILKNNLTKENIETEISFFNTINNGSFERMYGWTWILKLQQELDTWEDKTAQECANNLRPLSTFLCRKYMIFLPKLAYPIRSGEHSNTAFGLCFAYDYAVHSKNDSLCNSIKNRAIDFYFKDKKAQLNFEPSGYDFLSPTFEEIDLMRRVLEKNVFHKWLKGFLPEIYKKSFQLNPAKVLDRTDGKLVHLDGLNFSRTWCLNKLSKNDMRFSHLNSIAESHLNFSLDQIFDGDYMGEHWLASFAMEALLSE